MLSIPSVCIRCQFEAFTAALPYPKQLLSSRQPWEQKRSMAMAQRQRRPPSRMILTDDVSKSPSQGRQNERRKAIQPGPFGGMNRTEAKFNGKHMQRSSAEVRRSTSGKDPVKDKDEQKKDKPLFHALKMQSTLTPISYMQRNATKEKLESIKNFEEFDLLETIGEAIYSQALPGLLDIVPTPAQKLAIPALLESSHRISQQRQSKDATPKYDQFLLAAETGSGKTLGYLLPVLDSVKRAEVIEETDEADKQVQKQQRKRGKYELDTPEDEDPPHRTTGRPRALVLVPTAELVTQVGSLLKKLAHAIKFRSAGISAKHTPKYILGNLFNRRGIDIVVTTPHLISSIAKTEPNVFSRVSHLVIDEADSLLDRSFSKTTMEILDKVTPSLKQLIMCSATIPKSLNNFLDERFPSTRRLVTPRLHTIPRRVQLGVIDVDKGGLYHGNKSMACADIIWSLGKDTHEDKQDHHTLKSMLVFVNEREKAEEVATFLVSKGIDAAALTRDTSEERQAELLAKFTAPARQDGEEKSAAIAHVPFERFPREQPTTSSPKKLPNVKVIVTTDLGSRGIDTLAVRHVILYDVPHTTIDFIHRLGRTGRMGRRGRGVVLVGKHDRKDIVSEVQDGMFRGQALI